MQHRRLPIEKIYEELSGVICQRTKGHKKRWLGINDSLYEALIQFKRTCKHSRSTDPVIHDEFGNRISGYAVRVIHERVCEKAGLKKIRIHDLRHTYASHYIMNGGGLSELQALLGHSTPSMTLKYAHLAPGFLEKKAGIVSFGVPSSNVTQLKGNPHFKQVLTKSKNLN